MVNLRPYQSKAVENILDYWKENKAALLVQATGTGKTIVFSEIAKRIINDGGKVLILAHRDELIAQALTKLEWAQGIKAGIEKAEEHSHGESVVIGSVQTMRNPKRLQAFSPDYFTHIIIDEAHHASANSYKNILLYFSSAKVLGVTATPYRGDKQNLSDVFSEIVSEYPMVEAIKDGNLVPIKTKQIQVKINLNNVHQSAGDFNPNELDTTLTPYFEEIAQIMEKECAGRKTVVFLPLISTSQHFAKILNEHGISACEINGNTPNRRSILKDFEEGKIQVLCNAMLLTEGWDCPSVDCIVVLRPTRSKTLYVQMIGRGTRIAPNKDNLLILDFLWQSEKYDINNPVSLIAENDTEESLLQKFLNTGVEIDLIEAQKEAKEEIIRNAKKEREKTLVEAFQPNNKRKRPVDAFEFIECIEDEALMTYQPHHPWEFDSVSEKQISLLETFKIETSKVTTKGFASKLLDTLISRRKRRLATPAQLRVLHRYKFKDINTWSFSKAGKVIGMLSDNGWSSRNLVIS